MITPRQEALWVLRAQCHDREALESLLRSVQPPLHGYLRTIVGADNAHDALQDVLILLYRKLDGLENPEVFRPWAFRIASRVAFRRLKKQKRWEEELTSARLEEITAVDTSIAGDAYGLAVLRKQLHDKRRL